MSFPRLEVIAGPDKGKFFVIHEGPENLVGRHQEAFYRLTDPRVSRFHCAVKRAGDVITIVDNGGSGGTLHNGNRVSDAKLKHGDTVQVGESLMRLLTHAPAEADTLPGVKRAAADYDPKVTAELAELAGRQLAHYEIHEVVGRGLTGLVFRATDTEDGKTVALKVMQAAFSEDEEDMQRFVRAMRTMLPLKHPNLVNVYSAGKSGPYCWAAMEFVEGEPLTNVIRRIGVAGMLDWRTAFRVGLHIARGLAYAHGKGVIHRNITPANILIRSSDKQALLGDLMLAKALEGTLAKQVTKPGEVAGDVNYMSPERSKGISDEVDARSDIFSLGATVYALLAGKSPFAGSTLVETVTKVRTVEPIKPSNFQMSIPSAFEGVVLKMLAKSPAARYQTADEVVAELERIGRFNGEPV
jgi:serine/threonine protein kinase